MGCYNGTCMVTNLPITYQQDVVAYLVLYRTQNKIPTGAWVQPYYYCSPLSLPMYGEYDDYGGVSLIYKDNKTSIDLLSAIMATPAKNITNAINTDNVFPAVNGLQVGLLMIHRHIHDALADRFKSDVPTVSLKKIFEMERDIDNFSDTVGMMGEWRHRNDHVIYLNEIGSIRKVWEDSGRSDKTLNSIIQLSDSRRAFNDALLILRKIWGPGSGAGSQDVSLNEHLFLNKLRGDMILKSVRGGGMSDIYFDLV